MMVTMLIHAKLGYDTIIVDYVSLNKLRTISLLIVKIIFYLAIFVSFISVVVILT